MAVVVRPLVGPRQWETSFGLGIVTRLGTWGVNVFFLLSGFLLADYFWAERGRGSVLEYYVRRFFRIAPAYYVVVGFLFIFFADHALLFSHVGLRQVFANLTFTQWLTPGTSSNLNVDGSLLDSYHRDDVVRSDATSRIPDIAAPGCCIARRWWTRCRISAFRCPRAWHTRAVGVRSPTRPLRPRSSTCSSPASSSASCRIFVLGMATRWAVLHGHFGRRAIAPLRRPSLLPSSPPSWFRA